MEADMFQFMLPLRLMTIMTCPIPSQAPGTRAVTQQTAFRPSTCSRKSLLSWSQEQQRPVSGQRVTCGGTGSRSAAAEPSTAWGHGDTAELHEDMDTAQPDTHNT